MKKKTKSPVVVSGLDEKKKKPTVGRPVKYNLDGLPLGGSFVVIATIKNSSVVSNYFYNQSKKLGIKLSVKSNGLVSDSVDVYQYTFTRVK